jgi:hypothetical protein
MGTADLTTYVSSIPLDERTWSDTLAGLQLNFFELAIKLEFHFDTYSLSQPFYLFACLWLFNAASASTTDSAGNPSSRLCSHAYSPFIASSKYSTCHHPCGPIIHAQLFLRRAREPAGIHGCCRGSDIGVFLVDTRTAVGSRLSTSHPQTHTGRYWLREICFQACIVSAIYSSQHDTMEVL